MPDFLRLLWVLCVPVAALLGAELLWEKTWFTARHGPQMVGFAIGHILGPIPVLLTYATMVWLAVATVHWIVKRDRLTRSDVVRFLLALFVAAQAFVPDDIMARLGF